MRRKIFANAISIVMSVVIIAMLFSSCSPKEIRMNFVYPFTADVNSYDPQVASTSDEFLIIENTYEGLVRVNDDGTVVSGCAESWYISDDGLTYTFHIKKGLGWDIDTDKYETGEKKGEFKDTRLRMLGYEFNPEITAHDFVFALQRAVMPSTEAPMYPALSSIRNAAAIHSGKKKASSLGVTAVDDYTLRIKLSAKDNALMETLSSAIAMPCNKEFFEATGGRYGLELKYTLFNGQFYLSQILENSYLLKNNELYKGDHPTKINQLSFRILKDEEEADENKSRVGRLKSGYYDCAFITGPESAELSDVKGITYTPYEDTTWTMLFNTNNAVFQSLTMRRAFCLGLSRKSIDKDFFRQADTLTPPSCQIGSSHANEAIGATAPKQNRGLSTSLWTQGLEIIDTDAVTVTVLTVPDMEETLKELLQGVQSGIGSIVKDDKGNSLNFKIKIETKPQDEIETAIAKGEYDIALYPFKANNFSAEAFLTELCDSSKTSLNKGQIKRALKRAERAKSQSEQIKYLRTAEKDIISQYSVFPVLYETGYYAAAKGVSGVQFHTGTGRVSFVAAERKDS